MPIICKSTSTQACTVKLSSGSGKLQIQNVSINIHLRSSTPHLHFYLGEFDPYYGAFLIVQLANIDCLDVYKQQQVCIEEELSLSEVADEPQGYTTCSPPKVSFEKLIASIWTLSNFAKTDNNIRDER